MTAEATADSPTRSPQRPSRPRHSLFGLGVTLGCAVLTVLTAADWKYGTGFSILEMFEKLTNTNPVMSAIPNTEFSQLWSANTIEKFIETLRIAVLGTLVGSALALPLALYSTRRGAPFRWLQLIARSVANVVRALPDILWALVLVAAVGGGALSGLIALILFTIAVVTKLTADTLDGIDDGPIEAADAAGATHHQMLRIAQVPQILPAYASWVLYAFELNLRASAVLGIVGAGGIGERIETFRNLTQWERLWALVVLYIIVVFIVDRISTVLRARLI